jgi:hypothetical protein
MGACSSVGSKLNPYLIGVVGAFSGNDSRTASVLPTKGCDKSKQAIVNATNEIVATAIVLSVNSCTAEAQVDQQISITCRPTGLEANTQVYEENSACRQCYESVFNGMMAQHVLERKVWADGGTVMVRTPINEEYELMISRMQLCGVNTCKACALSNVTQANIIQSNTSCQNTMSNKDTFSTNLSSLVNEQLLNNQDVLSGVASAFGAKGVSDLTEQIVNQISTTVTQNFLTNTVNKMASSQVIILDSGTSTQFNNMTQYSSYNVALSEVTTNNIVTNAISDSVFATVAEIANQQNTLNDVGEVLFQSSVDFVTAINNVVGQVMIAVLVVLGCVVAFIIGYAIYKVVKKTAVSAATLAKKIELQRASLGALDQF